MELFFTNVINNNRAEAEFDAFESQHILKTLRKKEGDLVNFTDGQGKLYEGRIAQTKPRLKVEYRQIKKSPWPPPYYSILGIGFIRPSRMDYLIEKATELGINRFHLFSSRYTNYFTDNTSRWDKISRQAIKQSHRYYLPEIKISSNFSDFLKLTSGTSQKYLADQMSSNHLLDLINTRKFKSDEDIIFIIGPEGGFDDREIKQAKDSNFISVSFGDKRLRTETAAISAASYINLIRN